MAYLPRGIAPELLVSQVKNTMPYLFESPASVLNGFVPEAVLKSYKDAIPDPLSHFEYFRLCLSSHYLTCATPVPTDVDNQIRHKLWPAQVPLEVALEMARLVLESRRWDFTQVSSRASFGAAGTPWEKEPLTGHLGEWFTVSSGAYCALKQYTDPLASSMVMEMRDQLLNNIKDEIHRHSEIFGSLWRTNDGLGCLKAAASIAHNFGDLDRVMDMWDLTPDDLLRRDYYKLAVQPFDSNGKLRYLGRLWVAGMLYKSPIEGSAMALENHRHFALRKPKCLRQSPEILIPMGPFFDDWGRQLGRLLGGEDLLEVIDALNRGSEKMPKTLGYGRALRGIYEIHPELGSIKNVPQDRFEAKWNEEALKHLEEIPSHAT